MADKKISELTAITGSNTAATDVFVVVDTSTGQTKKITREELNNAIEQDVLSSIDIDTINGDFSVNGNINLGDNNKAVFGAGSDLEIYHDGSNSIVKDAGTGSLELQGSSWVILKGATSGNWGLASLDGAQTNLYHNGSLKLGTTATGIDVTGTVTADNYLYLGSPTGSAFEARSEDSYVTLSAQARTLNYLGTRHIFLGSDFSERMRITNTGRVGIGVSSPSGTLHAAGGNTNQLIIGQNTLVSGGTSRLQLVNTSDTSGTAGTAQGFQIINNGNDGVVNILNYKSTPMAFWTAGSERMRLDASGNLLVGKTAIEYTSEGFAFRERGEAYITSDGRAPLLVNRLTSDGDIVSFRKNGINAGSIGVKDQDLTIGTDDTGIRFTDATDEIRPWNTATNSLRDNAISIGFSTGRFKDLHLGGTAYAGGLSVSAASGAAISAANTGTVASLLMSVDSSVNSIYSRGVNSSTARDLRFMMGSTERARLTSDGHLGIGVSNNIIGDITLPNDGIIAFHDASGNSRNSLQFLSGELRHGGAGGGLTSQTFYTNGQQRVRIDSAGLVGIGVTSPAAKIDSQEAYDTVSNILTNGTYAAKFGGNTAVGAAGRAQGIMISGRSGNTRGAAIIAENQGSGNGHDLLFATSADASVPAERLRISSAGDVLISTTSNIVANSSTSVGTSIGSGLLESARAGVVAQFNRQTSDGSVIDIQKSGTTVGSIGTVAGDIVIGTGAAGLRFWDSGPAIQPRNSDGSANNDAIDLGISTSRFKDLHLGGTAYAGGVAVTTTVENGGVAVTTTVENGTAQFKTLNANVATPAEQFYVGNNLGDVDLGNKRGALKFFTGTTEKLRLDTSGNLLVGTTSTTPQTGDHGFVARANGYTIASVDNARVMLLNRDTSDGEILKFSKDDAAVGSIGNTAANLYIVDNLETGLRFDGTGTDNVLPCGSGGAIRDNAIDLGTSGGRFDDIFATNGTIQTSDRNEKQDIEALSEAEQRVAVAAKGLLRKFRWIDSVDEKGDDARIHFGIIAQDLQAAFEAEGLDAGRYAMFINSTWADEETGEERSRMGVRYNQLLAFIIAAI